MISRKTLIIALLFPILALAALVVYKKHILNTGQEVILPISGYDPRDLLSGHYLIYQVNYGVENICPQGTVESSYICLDNKTFSYEKPVQCKLILHGACDYGHFKAGIEKYYIPENRSEELTQKIRKKQASIVIVVPPSGNAQVKDLLIDGHSWSEIKK